MHYKFLINGSRAFQEQGFENFTGIICKLRTENSTATCNAMFDNFTSRCRWKKSKGCVKNLTAHIRRPNYVSFKVQNIKEVADSVKVLGVCCEYLEVQTIFSGSLESP
jgi:hypothetical protein